MRFKAFYPACFKCLLQELRHGFRALVKTSSNTFLVTGASASIFDSPSIDAGAATFIHSASRVNMGKLVAYRLLLPPY